jgi:hydrogenase maturation protease
MEKVLIIACGNPLRSDDGIAWRAAAELQKTFPASARVICVHQLTPELAEPASHADVVIFVDASVDDNQQDVLCQRISAQAGELRFSHHMTPETILTYCDRLYSAQPHGFLLSIRGDSFDYGEQLSTEAMARLRKSVDFLQKLVRSTQSTSFVTSK